MLPGINYYEGGGVALTFDEKQRPYGAAAVVSGVLIFVDNSSARKRVGAVTPLTPAMTRPSGHRVSGPAGY